MLSASSSMSTVPLPSTPTSRRTCSTCTPRTCSCSTSSTPRSISSTSTPRTCSCSTSSTPRSISSTSTPRTCSCSTSSSPRSSNSSTSTPRTCTCSTSSSPRSSNSSTSTPRTCTCSTSTLSTPSLFSSSSSPSSPSSPSSSSCDDFCDCEAPSDDERYYRPRRDIGSISDKHLRKAYRFGRAKLRFIASLVKEDMQPKALTNRALNLEQKICISIRVLASGSFQNVVGCSTQSVSHFLSQFMDSMLRNVQQVITFPLENQAWLQEQSNAFEARGGGTGLFGCIAAVDGTHIRIIKPSEDGDTYIGKNGKDASINVQITGGYNQRIFDVCATNPGSNHDNFVFKTSGLYDRLKTAVEKGNFPYYVIGDKGYGTSRILVSPVRDPRNAAEEAFNDAMKKMRLVIEQNIGGVKSKFRCTSKTGGHLCYKPEKAAKITVVSCMLHNIRHFDDFGEQSESSSSEDESDRESSSSSSNSESSSSNSESSDDDSDSSSDEDGFAFRDSLIDSMS